jgi:hypothetical protein
VVQNRRWRQVLAWGVGMLSLTILLKSIPAMLMVRRVTQLCAVSHFVDDMHPVPRSLWRWSSQSAESTSVDSVNSASVSIRGGHGVMSEVFQPGAKAPLNLPPGGKLVSVMASPERVQEV